MHFVADADHIVERGGDFGSELQARAIRQVDDRVAAASDVRGADLTDNEEHGEHKNNCEAEFSCVA